MMVIGVGMSVLDVVLLLLLLMSTGGISGCLL